MFERYFVKTRNLQFTLSYLNMHIGVDVDRYRVSTNTNNLTFFTGIQLQSVILAIVLWSNFFIYFQGFQMIPSSKPYLLQVPNFKHCGFSVTHKLNDCIYQ